MTWTHTIDLNKLGLHVCGVVCARARVLGVWVCSLDMVAYTHI